jgi:hypothetical protein
MPDRARTLWKDLHRQLRRPVDDSTARVPFGAIRDGEARLARFSSASEFLKYLAEDLSADLDANETMYSHLVTCAQKKGPTATFAQTLLWLGLWPGLSAAFARRAWFWRDCPEDLVSEVTGIFTTLVARMNLSRVRRVIANLVRSTESGLIMAGIKRDRSRKRVRDIDSELGANAQENAAQVGFRAGTWLPDALISVMRRRHGARVADAALRSEPARILGKALGLPLAVARKRLKRARDQLKRLLEDSTFPTARDE